MSSQANKISTHTRRTSRLPGNLVPLDFLAAKAKEEIRSSLCMCTRTPTPHPSYLKLRGFASGKLMKVVVQD